MCELVDISEICLRMFVLLSIPLKCVRSCPCDVFFLCKAELRAVVRISKQCFPGRFRLLWLLHHGQAWRGWFLEG